MIRRARKGEILGSVSCLPALTSLTSNGMLRSLATCHPPTDDLDQPATETAPTPLSSRSTLNAQWPPSSSLALFSPLLASDSGSESMASLPAQRTFRRLPESVDELGGAAEGLEEVDGHRADLSSDVWCYLHHYHTRRSLPLPSSMHKISPAHRGVIDRPCGWLLEGFPWPLRVSS